MKVLVIVNGVMSAVVCGFLSNLNSQYDPLYAMVDVRFPWPTQLVLDFLDFVKAYWWAIAPVEAAGLYLIYFSARHQPNTRGVVVALTLLLVGQILALVVASIALYLPLFQLAHGGSRL